jgi:glycerol-3-phosphate acyltransferase PlsY
LICLVFALLLMALTRMVSVGSIAAAVLFPVLVIFINQNYIVAESSNLSYLIFSVIIALLVFFNHRANLKRIATGTENKISFKK